MKVMFGVLAAVLSLAAFPAAAAEMTYTWFAPQPAAAEPGVRQAPIGDLFYAEPLAYAGTATLVEPYRTRAGVIAARETLFAAETRKGQLYYCSQRALRAPETRDAVGVALRSTIIGSLLTSSRLPRELQWQCFRDADGDMAFELVGGGQPGSNASSAAPSVAGVSDVGKLPTPIRYSLQAEKTPMLVGLHATPGRPRNGTPTYVIMLCQKRLGAEPLSNCFERPKWQFAGEPLAVETLGGRVTIEAITGAPGAEVVHYSVQAPISQRFGSVAQVEIYNGVVGKHSWLLVTDKK